jgi:superfamily II DNA or RNA helicase
MSGHWRHRPYENVQVASIQTIEKMGEWPAADLIIVDEIHASLRKSLKTYMTSNPDVKVLGLTATPYNPELAKHFTNIVNVVSMNDLVKEKFLVPFRVFVATEIETEGVKVMNTGEWQQAELEKRGLQIVGDVVADYVRIANEVWGKPKKTIVFSSGVAHGAELVKRFAEVGLNFVQISYLDDEEYKQQVIEDFAKPDTDIIGLISTDVLTRGFDNTEVKHVVLAKPLRKSFSMHVQMVGRGARPHPGEDFCVIQDNAGNWLRFIEDWDELYHHGTKTLGDAKDGKARKEKTKKEKEAAKCPKCSALWPTGSDTCLQCGHVRRKRSMAEEIPGEMKELSGAESRASKQEWWSMCQWKILNSGWSPGRAAHTYKDKYGVFPRGLNDVPAAPSLEFEKFVKAKLIRYLKGKK